MPKSSSHHDNIDSRHATQDQKQKTCHPKNTPPPHKISPPICMAGINPNRRKYADKHKYAATQGKHKHADKRKANTNVWVDNPFIPPHTFEWKNKKAL